MTLYNQHTTETALIKVTNDVLTSLDQGRCTILACLDLSAAFDTVDHNKLLYRLQQTYGICGIALAWFRSYLSQRQHRVSINASFSKQFKLSCGVPQGSVLGARIYTMYTKPLSSVFLKNNIMYHTYADDTQVYIQCDNTSLCKQQAITRLGNCIEEVCKWMSTNSLKLNEEKTECIIFSRKEHTQDVQLVINGTTLNPKQSIKNLGLTLGNKLSLTKQISNACRSTTIQLRKIN